MRLRGPLAVASATGMAVFGFAASAAAHLTVNPSQATRGGSFALGVAGTVLGLAGLVLGALALARTRRTLAASASAVEREASRPLSADGAGPAGVADRLNHRAHR